MDTLQDSTTPPLKAIQKKEAEITRRLAAAREMAAAEVTATQTKAHDMVAKANAEGQQEGKAAYQSILAETEQEVAAILAKAQTKVQALGNVNQVEIDTAVNHALTIILGEATG